MWGKFHGNHWAPVAASKISLIFLQDDNSVRDDLPVEETWSRDRSSWHHAYAGQRLAVRRILFWEKDCKRRQREVNEVPTIPVLESKWSSPSVLHKLTCQDLRKKRFVETGEKVCLRDIKTQHRCYEWTSMKEHVAKLCNCLPGKRHQM